MTTNSWVSVVDHSSDVGFRNWGSEFSSKMSSVGLVQTADTGQINWTTVTRPGSTYGNSGYEIWRFSDSSIYMKVSYGCAGTTSRPNIWIQVGTGSNGAGALTGQTSSIIMISTDTDLSSTTASYTSYMCATTNYFGVAWKMNATATRVSTMPYATFIMGKTTDVNANVTTTGFYLISAGTPATISTSNPFQNNYYNPSGQTQSVRTASPATTSLIEFITHLLIPGYLYTNLVNNVPPLFYFVGFFPDLQPFFWSFAVPFSFVPVGTTCTATPFGTTQHTYMSIGQLAPYAGMGSVDSAFGSYASTTTVCMLWE